MKLAFGCMGDVWAFGESCKESTISGIRTWTWHINERYDSSEEASFFLNSNKIFLIFKVLRKRNYSNTNTSFALYEASPLMRKRQAETLLGQSVEIESFD